MENVWLPQENLFSPYENLEFAYENLKIAYKNRMFPWEGALLSYGKPKVSLSFLFCLKKSLASLRKTLKVL